MSNIEFPFTDYSSGDENDTNILIAQNGNVSELAKHPQAPLSRLRLPIPLSYL